jgi:transposase
MRDTDLYSQILGITAPWKVSHVELDKPSQTVIVRVRLSDDAVLACPTCQRPCAGYDKRTRQWRHLNTMQFRTVLEADVPRVECPEHGIIQTRVPWAEPGSRFSAMFEAYVIDWLKVASTADVAQIARVGWKTANRIMERAVERGLLRRTHAPPRHIAIDETSFQRGYEYVTIVTDSVSGHVLHVADDRDSQCLVDYFESLSASECAAIQSVSMDMWRAFIWVARKYVPDAELKICFDKFHVAQYLSKCVDDVRRKENRELVAEGDARLKGSRFYWLQNPDRMSLKRWRSFEQLRDSSLRTAEAWAFKEHAMSLWHYTSRGWAQKQWRAWIDWALESSLAPVVKVAKIINDHLQGIINAVVLKKTNAKAESINSRIQKIKRRACGFRNRDRFRTAIMFHLAGLDLYPEPALCGSTHSIG